MSRYLKPSLRGAAWRRCRDGLTGVWDTLTDLVVPASCAACGSPERLIFEVCARCVYALEGLRARPTRPTPAPAGLPPSFALGDYGDELRELIIGFKDRGRHRLAKPLGALLAEAVATAVSGPSPILLLYVPDTASAARKRHGDHMRRLADAAVSRLRRGGRPAIAVGALRARAKADSAGLNSRQRADAACSAFSVRRAGHARTVRVAAGACVVLVDDVITTGATMAAAARILSSSGVEVDACVALAATQRRAGV